MIDVAGIAAPKKAARYAALSGNICLSNCGGSTMTMQVTAPSLWMKLPISLRAIISGLLIALGAANVWLLLLLSLGAPLAAIGAAIFLALYVWWAGGGGPPGTTQAARAKAFRRGTLSPRQWFWTVIAAFFFAATVH